LADHVVVGTREENVVSDYDSETPALRVTVYQEGRLVTEVLCESAEEAAEVARQWEEREGIECEVEDLGTDHEPLDVRAPEPEDVMSVDDSPNQS
jgi:hypothetical protein